MTVDDELSLYDLEMQTDEGRLSLAAAGAAAQVMNLLELAEAQSSMSRHELGQNLGVTDGRVSQVLNGAGNYHIATVARFLTAMGSRLTLTAVGPNGQVLRRVRRPLPNGKRRLAHTPVEVSWATDDGVHVTRVDVHHDPRIAILSLSVTPPWQTSGEPIEYQRNVEDAVVVETQPESSSV